MGWFRDVNGFRLCPKCFADTMPKAEGNPMRGMVLRSPAKGMVKPADPKAERIKAKKERKSRNMTRGTLGIVKLFIRGLAAAPQPIPEECPDCLALNRAA